MRSILDSSYESTMVIIIDCVDFYARFLRSWLKKRSLSRILFYSSNMIIVLYVDFLDIFVQILHKCANKLIVRVNP